MLTARLRCATKDAFIMVRGAPPSLALVVSPGGHPRLAAATTDDDVLDGEASAALAHAFEDGPGCGVLHLGAVEVATPLPPAFAYFRDLGHELVARVCAHPDLETLRDRVQIDPPVDHLERMAGAVPPMTGGEYVTQETLTSLWREVGDALGRELATWRA